MLKLYNKLTKKLEPFKPIKKNHVSMYVCGPTVYHDIHIGNARTFLAFDVIKRYLIYRGYTVQHVQNITDVGHLTEDDLQQDKLIKAAKKEKITPLDIAKKYTKRYQSAMKQLNWIPPDIEPKASKCIDGMIKLTQKLLKKGHAYDVDGTIYFDTTSFENYGKLSGNTIAQLEAGASERIKRSTIKKKRNPHDFALWFKAPPKHVMKWNSPFSVGYPGWHIECSVMSSQHLGQPFDIHGGGKDLIFPHHENEIAQSEAAHNKKFTNYWMHSEFLKINGEKMSKSLGNFHTADEFIEKYGAEVTRYLLISTHYQTELNINDKSVHAAKESLDHLQNTVITVRNKIKSLSPHKDKLFLKKIEKHKTHFIAAMDNNINTAAALAVLFDLSKDLNTYTKSKSSLQAGLDLFLELADVLGLVLEEKFTVPKEIKQLVKNREAARKQKDWDSADKLRKEITKRGYTIDDTDAGTIIRKQSNRK
jgi:cysteinyl-tRNA synthetase